MSISKTIQEIKTIKNDTESKILKLLKDFEEVSELKMDHVSVHIDRLSYEEEEKMRISKNQTPRKLKGVIDVTINANIANDPRSVD